MVKRGMIALPIPLVVALVLVFLLVRLWLGERRVTPLAGLLALCAVQSAIISLVQFYGVAALRPVQPVTASLIPAAAYLAFAVSAVRGPARGDLLHLAGPVAVMLALGTQIYALDFLIPALFVGYGLAILWRCLGGPDALPKLRLDAGQGPARIWIIIAVSLIFSAFGDVTIILAQIAGAAWLQPILISGYAATNLLIIGGLSLSEGLSAPPEDPAPPPPSADPGDPAIMEKLTALMAAEQPYLDPDLTLAKLARKLGVPAKPLSAAINRTTGQSVSRYINDARIKVAQSELLQGTRVTEAMLAAGFNTKSNFNREFLRVTGQSPSAWVQGQG